MSAAVSIAPDPPAEQPTLGIHMPSMEMISAGLLICSRRLSHMYGIL